MSNRKETPDLLGDILSPQPSAPAQSQPEVEPASEPASEPKPASRSAPKSGRRSTPRKPTQARAATAAALQWEYMEVIFREFRGWRPRVVNGEELENWREQPEIKDYLASVGIEGWEMVGIMENKRNTRSIYFKRPLP